MKIIHLKLILSFFFIPILLSGCISEHVETEVIPAHCKNLPLPKYWTARGVIAVKDKESRYTGRIIWEQNDERLRLILLNPVGLPYGTMLQTDTGYEWHQGESHSVNVNMNPLLYDSTGWKLPFDEAYYWIKNTLDKEDKIVKGKATIEVTHKTCVDSRIVPKKIRITHPEFTANIIINHWQFNS